MVHFSPLHFYLFAPHKFSLPNIYFQFPSFTRRLIFPHHRAHCPGLFDSFKSDKSNLMRDEVRIIDSDVNAGDGDGRVLEWEAGLPNLDDLPPLSQALLSAELASAFSITPEPYRSMIDVDRASRNTLSSLQGQSKQNLPNKLTDCNSFSDGRGEEMVVEGEETVDLTREGSDSRKLRRVDSGGGGEEADSALRADDSSARTSKRSRLVWTPQLHKRFIEVVAHLGVKNAVPKTIMQLMNVEGLTRENVASHLQKYRLYVKRIHGSSNAGPSPPDPLFGSTPVPKSLHDSDGGGGIGRVPSPVPYPPQMVPMPYPPPQMAPNTGSGGGRAYHRGFESQSHPDIHIA